MSLYPGPLPPAAGSLPLRVLGLPRARGPHHPGQPPRLSDQCRAQAPHPASDLHQTRPPHRGDPPPGLLGQGVSILE